MRLRTRVSCAVMTGIGVSALGALVTGCISDDNAADTDDSGVDATMNPPDTSTSPPALDTGADTTAPNTDAGQDAGDDSAVNVADTGVDAGCSPSLAAGWQPPAYVVAARHPSGPCNHASIDALFVDCLGDGSTASTCASYSDAGAAYPGCASCLLTPEDASTYGAAVVRVVPQINVAGCIQIADPSDAGFACAAAVQAVQACAEASCRASCAITSDPASVAAYVACTKTAAASTACSAWATPAHACVNAEEDAGGQLTTCFSGATDDAVFDDIGVFFCDS